MRYGLSRSFPPLFFGESEEIEGLLWRSETAIVIFCIPNKFKMSKGGMTIISKVGEAIEVPGGDEQQND